MSTQHDLPDLWHMTCGCSAASIQSRGALLSRVRLATPTDRIRLHLLDRTIAMSSNLVWMTSLPNATSVELGLSRSTHYCDRAVVRFRVLSTPAAIIEPWSDVRKRWPLVVVAALEVPGTRPEHWFVSAGPIAVALDVSVPV